MTHVAEFGDEHGVSANALKNVVKSLLSFFKSAVKSNLTPSQVKEDLEHLGEPSLNGSQSYGSIYVIPPPPPTQPDASQENDLFDEG